MPIEFSGSHIGKIEKANQDLQEVLRVDLRPIEGEENTSLSKTLRLLNRRLRDAQGEIPSTYTAEQLDKYEQVLSRVLMSLDKGLEYIDEHAEDKEAQQSLVEAATDVIQDEGGLVDGGGKDVPSSSPDFTEALSVLYGQTQDAIGRVGSEKIRRAISAAQPREKTEAPVKPPEGFNPEQYRDVELPKKIESYRKLRAVAKTFGRTDVILVDTYQVTSLQRDLQLVRQARIDLETEAINIAAEPAKVAQIRQFVLPAIDILEQRLNEKGDQVTRETARLALTSWEGSLKQLPTYTAVDKARKDAHDAVIAKNKTLQEYIRLYNTLQSVEGQFQVMRAGEVGKLPANIQKDGGIIFDQHQGETQVVLDEVRGEILGKWKRDIDAKPEVRALEDAIRRGFSPGADVRTIEGQEQAINDAIAQLNPIQLADVLPVDIQREAQDYVRQKIAVADKKKDVGNEQLSVREFLARRKAELAAATLGQEKRELSAIVSEIEALDYRDDDDFAAHARLSDLEDKKRRLHAVRDKLRDQGIAFIDVDSRYNKEEARLLGFIERARIQEMSFADIVKRVKSARYDVFKSSTSLGNITDPIERALIKRFQGFYFDVSENYGESLAVAQEQGGHPFATQNERNTFKRQKELEHRRLKVEIWAFRYSDEHDGGQYVPAAEVTNKDGEDILYGALKGRKLFREDLLAVTMDPKYGETSRNMLFRGIQVIAGEIVPPGQKLDYGALAGAADGPKLLRDYLAKEFVGQGSEKIPQDQFDILWDLFVGFDLASIGLARAQKATKTRSHNPGKKIDTEFLCYPFHVMSHMRNRYGNIEAAAQHLLVFTGKYPGKPQWAGNEEMLSGTRVRTEEETRQLIVAFMRAHMPLEGIADSVLLSGTDAEWNHAIFPDHFDFLTAATSTSKDPITSGQPIGSVNEAIGNTDLYNVAQEGWGRMLDMTVKSLSSGPLTLHDIFKDGGVYKQFVNEGIGKAKVVKGEHYKFFVPMLRYFIGRISVAFADEGMVARRRELKEQLIEQMKTSTGLDIPEIKGELNAFIRELEDGRNNLGPAWGGVPEILTPYDDHRRRNERVAYMRLWWADKKKGKSSPPPVSTSVMPSVGAGLSGVKGKVFNDPDVQIFYDAIEERIPLPQIIDRSAFNTDTSAGKK